MASNQRTLTRRTFLGAAAGTGVVLAQGCASTTQEKVARLPNVIYAFSDEHRWQSMSFTEMPQVQTPNMARLAAQGAEFTHCISNYPVCSPYRALLMTGMWPYQQGVIDNSIPLSTDHMTLGKAFQNAGYRTGYIGKWHLGGERAEPFGFEHSLIWTGPGNHWEDGQFHAADGPIPSKGYNATAMTDRALDFIGTHRHEPFFLMLSWHPPHANFLDPPEAKLALYPEGSLPRRPNTEGIEPGTGTEENILKANTWPYYRGYHGHISAIDDELGRLLAALDEWGIDEDTILVYTSDHGSMFGSHGVGSKRQPYEESIRVPFLVRYPRLIEQGIKSDTLFGAIDIPSTVCGLAGVQIPSSFRGLDFSPHVTGGHGPRPESQFIMHIEKKGASGGENHPAPLFRGVRTERYTYASLAAGGGLLFDNVNDPYQMTNLHDDPESRRVREHHETLTRRWLAKASDPYTIPA